jgi:spermidine/putrescine transport system permease protein
MERSKRFLPTLGLPFAFWFVVCLLGPLLFVIITSFARRGDYGQVLYEFSWDSYRELLKGCGLGFLIGESGAPIYLKILGRTLLFALANTVVVLMLAYPFAFYVTRLQGHRRIFWLLLILVPSWTNFLIRIHAVADVLRLIRDSLGIDWTYSPQGIVFTMVYEYLPLGILPLYAALAKIDNSLIEAARDLGAKSTDIFFKILLPLTKSGLFAAGVFVLIPSLGEYLIPEIIGGGRYFVLGNFLHSQFITLRNYPLGSAFLTLILTLTLFMVVFGGDLKREDT